MTPLNAYLLQHNTALNVVLFELAARLSNNDINEIYRKLINSGLDESSRGFWIWDIPNGLVIYSPKFRETLGYENEIDFPNHPASWQQAIMPYDLDITLTNYERHVESMGKHPFEQFVTYNKKNGGTVDVLCHGKVVSWHENEPLIMVGVHMNDMGSFDI